MNFRHLLFSQKRFILAGIMFACSFSCYAQWEKIDSCYMITNEKDLITLTTNVENGNSYQGKCFKIHDTVTAIVLHNFTPIGSFNKPFNGSFDGNNKIINGTIKTNRDCAGLFGCTAPDIKGMEIKNIILSDCNISGNDYVGGILGYQQTKVNKKTKDTSSTKVINCIVTDCIISGNNYVGGLIGNALGLIENCGSRYCQITAKFYVGGLFGNLSSTVSNSYSSKCNIIANNAAGGLIGQKNSNAIFNCYAANKIDRCDTSDKTNFGSFVGKRNKEGSNNCFTLAENDWRGNNLPNNIHIDDTSVVVKTFEEMKSEIFVNNLNNYTTNFFVHEALWLHNDGLPVLFYELVMPRIIRNGEIMNVPNDYSLSDTSVLTIRDGGQFINKSKYNFNIIFERIIDYNKWEFFGSPTGNTTFGFFSNDTSFLNSQGLSAFRNSSHNFIVAYPYNYNDNNWYSEYAYRTDSLKAGEGIFVWNGGIDISENNEGNNTATTIYFNGETINTSPFYFSVQNYNEPEWIALSNPYPAAIHSSSFIKENEKESLFIQGKAVYIWDKNLNNTGDWIIKDMYDDTLIYPSYGFMIAFPDSIMQQQVMFSKEMYNEPNKTYSLEQITINATTNNFSQKANIAFLETASNDFDIYDAYALFSDNHLIVSPYFNIKGHSIVKNTIKELPYETAINFHSYIEKEISLSFLGIRENVQINLIDLKNGTNTQIYENEIYPVYIYEGENANRFILKLSHNSTIDKLTDDKTINIWVNENRITIDGDALESIEIYNLIGKRVFFSKLSCNYYTDILPFLHGYYIAKVHSKYGSKTIKFVLE